MGWCLYQESHCSVTLYLFNIDKFISEIVSVKGHELKVEWDKQAPSWVFSIILRFVKMKGPNKHIEIEKQTRILHLDGHQEYYILIVNTTDNTFLIVPKFLD